MSKNQKNLCSCSNLTQLVESDELKILTHFAASLIVSVYGRLMKSLSSNRELMNLMCNLKPGREWKNPKLSLIHI